MARRVISRNFEVDLPGNDGYASHLKRLSGRSAEGRVIGYKNDTKLTCSDAVAQLRDMKTDVTGSELDAAQERILKWLKHYITELSAKLAQPF
jgi:hypothetical protein